MNLVKLLMLLVTMSFGLSGCYVTSQAFHQNNLFNSRRQVSEVLADPKTSSKTRESLLLSRQILSFAAKSGLNAEGAYTYFIQTDEPAVSYLVQAAKSDRLESITWWFPVVGRVPYLGFFRRSDRDDKARELRDEGYDVYETGVSAFSSLGWFEDPIFSPMLLRNEADFAHLLFHELTHRTLWVAGSTEFNENLAEYVAEILTIDYLKSKSLTAAVAAYEEKRKDRVLFKSWLTSLKTDLEKLYAAPPASREELLVAKKAVFERYTVAPLKPSFKIYDYVDKAKDWNNAAVLGANLYSPDTSRFAIAAKCVGGTIKDFLMALESADGEGFAALDQLCKSVGEKI